MYIVAIAWLYVVLLVSIMQPTVLRGLVTFVGAGLFPLALLLYLLGTPQRARDRRAREAAGAEPGGIGPGAGEPGTGEPGVAEPGADRTPVRDSAKPDR